MRATDFNVMMPNVFVVHLQFQSGASVIVIHPNGAVHKDGRLKVFDKIVEIDGKKISSETSDHEMNKIFQSHYHKVCEKY